MKEKDVSGRALRALRVLAGLSLDQVSQRAGVSVSYLSRAENGLAQPTAAWFAIVYAAIGSAVAERDAA